MPSPFGYRRGPSTYYEHAGAPQAYAYDWDGMPMGSQRAAETRALGGDYLDILARFHKDLGDYDVDYPVSMSQYGKRRSILHSGPEQTHIHDAPLGFFGQMSDNEKRLLYIGGAALLGWFLWKKKGRKR